MTASGGDILERVIRVIAEAQRIPIETIRPEDTFAELNIDSLDGINIVFAIENEFGISIPDEGAKSLRSVADVAAGVERLLGSSN